MTQAILRDIPRADTSRETSGVLCQAGHTAVSTLLSGDAVHDVPTVVSAWHALRLVNPKAGRPMYQRDYDRFFDFFKMVSDSTPENTEEERQLSEIRDDYMQLLADNLDSRSDEEYRSESYYWLTVKAARGYSPSFLSEALARDAEKRVFGSHRLLTFYHASTGAFIPTVEATWLVNIFIGMQLTPGHRFSFEAECIRMACENLAYLLNMADEYGRYVQLLVLLYLRTGEDRYRQLADTAIAAWPEQGLPLEQAYFRSYYQTAQHRLKDSQDPHG